MPYFKRLTEAIETGGKIPESWIEAEISFIHKSGMERNQLKNYRPISLLNMDYKIFASILANRLKKALILMVHKDQTGFLPKRKLGANIRAALDLSLIHI